MRFGQICEEQGKIGTSNGKDPLKYVISVWHWLCRFVHSPDLIFAVRMVGEGVQSVYSWASLKQPEDSNSFSWNECQTLDSFLSQTQLFIEWYMIEMTKRVIYLCFK